MTYRNPVAAHARIIQHDYMDASDNYGQYLADERRCQAVTAAFLAEPNFFVDTFWRLAESMEGKTLELCESVDPRVDGTSVDIWTYNGRCISEVDPETVVYVSKDALTRQGFDVPPNAETKRAAFDAMFRRLAESAREA